MLIELTRDEGQALMAVSCGLGHVQASLPIVQV
jgi:hypothetical protein